MNLCVIDCGKNSKNVEPRKSNKVKAKKVIVMYTSEMHCRHVIITRAKSFWSHVGLSSDLTCRLFSNKMDKVREYYSDTSEDAPSPSLSSSTQSRDKSEVDLHRKNSSERGLKGLERNVLFFVTSLTAFEPESDPLLTHYSKLS